MKVVRYSNKEIIEGIRNNDEAVISYIYKASYEIIHDYVVARGGASEDALDVFQVSIITLRSKVFKEEPEIYVDFKYFLLGYAKKIWLRELEKKKRNQYQQLDSEMEDETNILHKIISSERLKLMWEYVERLPEICRVIIRSFLSGKRHKETASDLKLTEGQVKKRKYNCQQKLMEAMQKDSRYNELKGVS